MDLELLHQAGLSPSQAKAYLALIQHGQLTPPQLAGQLKESRTNAYMVLKRLEALGLAHRLQGSKTAIYIPQNPVALEEMMQQRRKAVHQTEEQIRQAMPNLLSYFYTFQHQPGVRFFQGKEALTQIYEDQLRTRQPVYFIRTPEDAKYFGDTLYHYMEQRAKLGIQAHGLAPDISEYRQYAKENDAKLKREMSWYPPTAYTAPVEISIYGNKVSLLSFGQEAIGTIIESPQIAEALRQVFAMAKRGAEAMTQSDSE